MTMTILPVHLMCINTCLHVVIKMKVILQINLMDKVLTEVFFSI